MFGDAPGPVAAGNRRTFQRRRQRHLLRLRAGLATWGTENSLTCKVASPPGLELYARLAAHIEINYDTFFFNLSDKDITFTPATREVASGTDIAHSDDNIDGCVSTGFLLASNGPMMRDLCN